MLNRGKLSISKPDGNGVSVGGNNGGAGAVYLHNNHPNVENGRFHVAKVNSLGMSATSPGSLVSQDTGGGGDDDFGNGGSGPGQQYSTYVYDTRYAKSLGQLTREALPKLDNYRDLMSVHNAHRPTLDELHNATLHEKSQMQDEESGPELKGKVIKFSWLEGVLMRCLLNIWGVMLFLRLSWVIGQAGIIEGLLVITLANIVTVITGISMSAVSTNGLIKGGGIYYMISRSLGPEFGAAIGLMFTIANSIAVSLYIVGFCESLNDLLEDNGVGFLIDGGENDVRVIGVGILILILILAFVGMDWVTRTQMFLLVVLLAAQVVFIVGTFVGPMDDEEKAKGFIGYNFETFKNNLLSDYRLGLDGDDSQQSFFSVFGVFFPAVTGIVAGANLSGDLKDPSSAIPKGTLLAILLTYISYVGYGIMMGGCVEREASGNVTQYLQGLNYTQEGIEPPEGFVGYQQCTSPETGDNICKYGLLNSPQVMELVSVFGYLIYAGCFAATLSSAIASLVGAPRVLQALAKDKLYPKIEFFAQGYGANNDPVRGYILVFIVSLGCLLIAQLNAIAPLLSNFFLAAYCLINFSVFHASITNSPGWRPSFKYYNAWVSLGGSILCVAVMFLMSWVTALITVAVCIFLYLYISYRKPDVNWGSSTQAQSYNSALKSVQELNMVDEHVKNYRPQILVLSGMPGTRPPLVDFAYLLVKNLSLMICGHVVNGAYNQRIRNSLQKQGYNWLLRHKKKGFFALIEDDSFERGCKSLMQIAGLGKLKPNMVLLGYKRDWIDRPDKVEELMEYFNVIHAALDMHLAVGILRVPEGLDYSNVIEEEDQMQSQQLLDVNNKETQQLRRNISESQFSIDSTTSTESQPAPPQIPLNPSNGHNNEKSIDANTIPMPDQVPAKLISDTPTGGSKKKKKGRRVSLSALYSGPGGTPLPRHVLANVTQFARKQKKSTIDVWWLYDDGGLTMLLPYILTTRSVFNGCQLRVFTLTTRKEDLGREQRNMAALLAKFRIDFSDVIVIPDITKKAQESTKKEFETLIEPFRATDDVPSKDGMSITEAELMAHKEKTNRHLRLSEALRLHSRDSTFVVMTLPMPRKGAVSGPLYMAWLEMMTKDMPPFLIVRGNQMSVLTFYS